MNAWTRDVISYLSGFRNHDPKARALLARAPRRAPKKPAIPSVAHAVTRRRQEELAEDVAIATMRRETFAWNLEHTRGPLAPFGLCDCGCGRPFPSEVAGELDHWINRSQGGPHTRANGWRLAGRCHRNKDRDRAAMNEKRRAYCERAGIPFIERRVRP